MGSLLLCCYTLSTPKGSTFPDPTLARLYLMIQALRCISRASPKKWTKFSGMLTQCQKRRVGLWRSLRQNWMHTRQIWTHSLRSLQIRVARSILSLVMAKSGSEPPDRTENHWTKPFRTEPPWTAVQVQFVVSILKFMLEPVWTGSNHQTILEKAPVLDSTILLSIINEGCIPQCEKAPRSSLLTTSSSPSSTFNCVLFLWSPCIHEAIS